ncbi:MAG: hypothetical protein ACI8S6_001040 [Myxococcota bacterium]|jgi:hypothetical protein
MAEDTNGIQWPTDPQKKADLAQAFDEGEYQYERARDIFGAISGQLAKARESGSKEEVALLEQKYQLALKTMSRLRYSAIKVD